MAVNRDQRRKMERKKSMTSISASLTPDFRDKEPHKHNNTDIHMFPDSSFDAASNHCRSPDRRNGPWCYTTNKDKRWEHCDIPMCSSTTEIQCPERIIPEDPHLEHVPGGVKPGSVASFRCAPGYNLIGGSSTIGCTPRGFWKDVLPHCEKINCGSPPNMSDATTTFNGTEFGDSASYTCDVGFQFPSPTSVVVVQCTDTGTWTTAPEACGGGQVSFFFSFP
ncbi:hypothetical protein LSAT2_019314 [Lamellibrachia satsuma]|nr:hypothetical protein LSAT2_019314 [Lamellibrachia satsuma]